jgi:hypothetical protein
MEPGTEVARKPLPIYSLTYSLRNTECTTYAFDLMAVSCPDSEIPICFPGTGFGREKRQNPAPLTSAGLPTGSANGA